MDPLNQYDVDALTHIFALKAEEWINVCNETGRGSADAEKYLKGLGAYGDLSKESLITIITYIESSMRMSKCYYAMIHGPSHPKTDEEIFELVMNGDNKDDDDFSEKK